MHLDLTPEALLKQLGYSINIHTQKQIDTIIENTQGFEKFSPHIPSFSDALAVEKGYIAMSNSQPYFKIKCEEDISADNLSAFNALVEHWGEKYKLKLQKIADKNTYYLIGHL